MRISRDTLEGLVSLAEKQRSSSFELEAALFPSNDVPRQTAIHVIELMRRYYVPLPISDTLDVSYAVDGMRLSVTMTKSPDSELGPLIKSLAGGKPPPPTKSSLISKTPVNRIAIPEYSLRVHLREESKRPLKDLPSFENAELLRFKRRYSFSVTPNFRVDITAVRSLNPKGVSTLLMSKKLFASPETYEFEVEHIAAKDSESKPETVVRNLIEHYSVLLRSVQDSAVALSAQDFERVRKLYSEISGTSTFVAPKPSTLELVHFLPDQSPSITSDVYSVTEKADGERRLLISDSDLGLYSIDSRMDVHALPPELRASRPRCMLDGEHISHGGKRPDQFAIFDCYFVDGKSLLHRSLPERLDAAKTVLKGVVDDDRLFVKTFMHNCSVGSDKRRRSTKTKSIFELSAEVLKRREIFTYRIDGLIFTPCAPPSDVTSFANWRSWPSVLKWKPPEDNTIDFMVNMLPRKRGRPYAAELMVGHLVQEGEEATRDLRSFLLFRGGSNGSSSLSSSSSSTHAPPSYNKKNLRYEHRPFAFLEPDSGAGLSRVEFGIDSPVCTNGDAIINGSVVEFAYRDGKWVPLRVRHDKTEEARHFGRITANNYKTAMNVWQSIMHPVSENMITGTEKIDETAIRKQLATSSYFAVRIRPGEGGLVEMRRFHNFVKGYLISWFGKMASVDGIGPRIFDFGVGKAGDLHKWIDVGASKVVGIDRSVSNLTDPVNGAYSRVINLRTSQPMPETFFFEFDATSELYDPSIPDPLVRSALIGIYPKGDKVARAYSGFARTGMFDIATCMFAAHYFFDSVAHIETFCRNVASVLRPGGVFVGISPDGEAIEMALNASDDGTIEGTHGDDVIWRMSKGESKMVDVFVETIGQTIPEPMLMFKELVKAMNVAGLRPLTATELRNSGFGKYSTSMLGEFMEKLKDGQLHDVDEDIIKMAKKDFNMSDDQKQYSYFNRWFAFRKPA
jgi:SAM-dependent methyltransferase